MSLYGSGAIVREFNEKMRERFKQAYGEDFLGADWRMDKIRRYLRITRMDDTSMYDMFLDDMLDIHMKLKEGQKIP
jgi:hypothetical protein